ncbi:MAG: branched-chain amino acid transport system ATP-binding protein livM [Solirubrobacteraceae bacterium]|jgi:branched-chain amino acid transport system permease protein|nr:branched-chain amino acid transport system ATP-binding protein livM [Solirubrobacteraceae bacterium]
MIDYVDQFLIMAIFAMSLNLLTGVAGQVSVAHAAFGGVGGFLAGYLALKHGWSFVPAVLVAIPAGCLFGAAVGLPALMLSTEHLILLTLAVQTASVAVILSIPALGGVYGLVGLPAPELAGKTFLTPPQYFPLLLVVALIVLGVCLAISHSRFGRVLRGIREDETATRSLGQNVFAYKVVIFAVTSGMAALAGALLVFYSGIAAPQVFDLSLTIAIVAMIVVGGTGNLAGALLGAGIIVGSTPFFQSVINLSAETTSLVRQVAYGAILVGVLMVRPSGLLPEGVRLRRSSSRAAPGGPGTANDTPPEVAAPTPDLQVVRGEPAEVIAAVEPYALVEVRRLSKTFGGIRAVDGLDLTLDAGKITGLIGPNGAGKTTVFNLLTGATKPDAGTVVLRGTDITGWSPNRVAVAGMARSFQDVRIFAGLTVLENVRMCGCTRDEARAQLAGVGLEGSSDLLAGSLSFGEQKLVALARLLATNASVLLLDEPASGIDAGWVDTMLEIVAGLRRPDRAICIVEHNLHVVERLADRVCFMENGQVTAEGTMEDLAKDPRLTEVYFGAAV